MENPNTNIEKQESKSEAGLDASMTMASDVFKSSADFDHLNKTEDNDSESLVNDGVIPELSFFDSIDSTTSASASSTEESSGYSSEEALGALADAGIAVYLEDDGVLTQEEAMARLDSSQHSDSMQYLVDNFDNIATTQTETPEISLAQAAGMEDISPELAESLQVVQSMTNNPTVSLDQLESMRDVRPRLTPWQRRQQEQSGEEPAELTAEQKEQQAHVDRVIENFNQLYEGGAAAEDIGISQSDLYNAGYSEIVDALADSVEATEADTVPEIPDQLAEAVSESLYLSPHGSDVIDNISARLNERLVESGYQFSINPNPEIGPHGQEYLTFQLLQNGNAEPVESFEALVSQWR